MSNLKGVFSLIWNFWGSSVKEYSLKERIRHANLSMKNSNGPRLIEPDDYEVDDFKQPFHNQFRQISDGCVIRQKSIKPSELQNLVLVRTCNPLGIRPCDCYDDGYDECLCKSYLLPQLYIDSAKEQYENTKVDEYEDRWGAHSSRRNPYFDDDNWYQREMDTEDAFRRAAD